MDTFFETYGVIAGNVVVANAGVTKIVGDLSSNSTITGSGSVIVSGQTNIGALTTTAQDYYDDYMSRTPNVISSVANIGGTTFNPGIINLTNGGSGIAIGGVGLNQVTLDGDGYYFFQLPTDDLIATPTGANVSFILLDGATSSNVFWVINGNVNLQTKVVSLLVLWEL